jgi:hypothetical protein
MLANKALQYHLLTESFGVAIYDTNETGHVAIISNLWQPNIYRGDRWFHL